MYFDYAILIINKIKFLIKSHFTSHAYVKRIYETQYPLYNYLHVHVSLEWFEKVFTLKIKTSSKYTYLHSLT